MRVAVVHNAIAKGEADPSTLDVLDQAQHIRQALLDAGHAAELFPFDRDVAKILRRLARYRAEYVFNLVESVEGHAALHPCAAAIWEMLGLPHSGCSARALEHTTDKALAKTLLARAGIPTAEWALCDGETDAWRAVSGPWILKPMMEDASIGIDEDSVVRDPAALPGKLRALRRRFPLQPILVERYIEGREFNISILAMRDGPCVLPPVEMVFVDYPPGKERVLGFRAKWDPTAFEYDHTVRRFDFPPEDAPGIERLRALAKQCWEALGLNGYARVDVRVDDQWRLFVIEINANPCLSPDAGFAAAVARAGLSPARMVQHILEDSVWVPRPIRSTSRSVTKS